MALTRRFRNPTTKINGIEMCWVAQWPSNLTLIFLRIGNSIKHETKLDRFLKPVRFDSIVLDVI
jgi:hypothetical protein